VSPTQEWEPLYIFECKDSTGLITYKQIYLNELPQSYGVISNYYEVVYEDMTSYDTTDMVSIKTLPLLIKSPIFKRHCREVLNTFSEVNLLIYIDNVETDPQYQYNMTINESEFK